MIELEKLRNTLKGVPEIKENLEELKFGCSVFIQNYITSVTIIGDNRGMCIIEGTEYTDFLCQTGTHTQAFEEKHITKIIGNSIQYNHLLRYFENKKIYAILTPTGRVSIINNIDLIKGKGNFEINNTNIKLDLKKDLEDQPEEVLKEINNFINNLK